MPALGIGDPRADFPATAPAANPVFYRTYSRKNTSGRESWSEVSKRYSSIRRMKELSLSAKSASA